MMRPIVAWCLLALVPFAARAQDTVIVIRPESLGLGFEVPELARALADEAIRFFNAPGTARLAGRTVLPRGGEWRGNVAVRGGPVELAGRLDGSLLVINGDAVLLPGAEITGSLLVVGGGLRGADSATVAGGVRVHRELLWYRVDADTISYAPSLRRRFPGLGARGTWTAGETKTSLTLATAGTYNRVEGLPVVFGPTFEWYLRERTRLRLDALGMFRLGADLSDDRSDLGYQVRVEFRRGETTGWGLGVRGYDVVAGIEDWKLHNDEVGWAAFLARRDYRDYFHNRGVAARVFAQPAPPVSLGLELRYERQFSEIASDPISVVRNSEPWRPNPPIDGGFFTTVGASVGYDTRNDRWDPTAGWLLRGTLEFTSSDDVSPQPGIPPAVRDSIRPNDYHFTRAWLDGRRYLRLSQGSRLNLRLLAGGWLGGDPLPMQRRLSLEGPDPLPGYGFRYLACNAAITDSVYVGTLAAACDRVLLAQLEFRGHVSLRWVYDPERDPDGPGLMTVWFQGLDVVAFVNGGQAWLVGSGAGQFASDEIPPLRDWLADLGLGIDWGGLGIYVAKAVTAREPVRVILRLDHRF